MAQYQAKPNYAPSPTFPSPIVPAGTLAPGTIITVGEYVVKVERFLSEGGFAHVYLATSEQPIPIGSPYATRKHVLKRIAVPDKAGVAEVGKEVEVMKLLRNHPRIVNFIEASFSEIPATTGRSKAYEIFILMEWCAGGGIIDMMNTRLQNRMTESEILKIFSDVVEAVAHMHYQSPPLIHRDLKVENILLSPPQSYKLCDFGSTTTPLLSIPSAVADIQAMEADINKTTTLQYRAPELMDVWSRKGFDEKIDIWALGVFLYKLCYYTTPFEEAGPLAIINAQYKIPTYPAYSNDIKHMIAVLLQESAPQRPNIFQVHERVCKMRGTSVKIENKYARPKGSLPPRPKSASISTSSNSSNYDILSKAPPVLPTQNLETIAPMRRGRPLRPTTAAASLDTSATSKSKTGAQSMDIWAAFKEVGTEVKPIRSVSSFDKPVTNGTSITPASSSFGDSFNPVSSESKSTSNKVDSTQLFADLLPPQNSGRSNGSNKMMAQLTGELNPSIPPSPVPAARPPSAQQELPKISSSYGRVSKSAQTSPHLMANWKPPAPNPLPELPPLPASLTSTPSENSSSGNVDILSNEFDYPNATNAKSTFDPPSIAPLAVPKKTKRLSFIGGPSDFNFESNKAPFRPTPKSSSKISTVLPLSKPVMRSFEEAAVRYPSLEEDSVVRKREESKREEESWAPIVERDESSSDEEVSTRAASPSIPEGRPPPKSFTPPSEPISRQAVSVSQKSIPSIQNDQPPPTVILQPQPQSAVRKEAISNLVSQFEIRSSDNLKPRPSLPTKPINLRKTSTTGSTMTTRSQTPVPAVIIDSPATPPSDRYAPAISTRTVDRLPFKPVAPPSPSGNASTRPLPRFIPPVPISNNEEEEEVAFAGVSSMVSRWQNMGAANVAIKIPKK